MIRLLLRLSGLQILAFAAAVGLIRAQPYDDTAARAVFRPETCALPCLMGIRPGVTRVDEALNLLETHEWVDQLDIAIGNLTSIYSIDWSGEQPDYINPAHSGRLVHLAPENIIQSIEVHTVIPVGALYLLLGEPTHINVHPLAPNGSISLVLFYADEPFIVQTSVVCPFNRHHFWSAAATVEMTRESPRFSGAGNSVLPTC